MHVLTISDPWFGAYIRVVGANGNPLNLTLQVGPLFVRTLHVESLDNKGLKVRHGNFNEKTCHHNFVAGSIVGVMDEPENNFGFTSSRLESGVFDYSIDHVNTCPHCGLLVRMVNRSVLTLDFNEVAKSATLRCLWEHREYFIHDDNSEFTNLRYEQKGTVTFEVLKDPISGSKAYRNPTVGISEGLNGIAVIEVTPPYGSYGDTLGDNLPLIADHISTVEDDLSEGRVNMTKRDEAIYQALDNISLAGINPLSDFADLTAPLEPLKQLVKLLRIHSLMDIFRNLGSLHLMYKYVLKTNLLTISECKKLFRVLRNPSALVKKSENIGLIGRGEAKEEFDNGPYHTTVVHSAKLCYEYNIKNFDDFLNVMNLLGLTPRITDLWDDLPLSFVLDWIIPIGEFLNNMELNGIQQQIPFLYGVLGTKTLTRYSRSFIVNNLHYEMNLVYSSYVRTVIDSFPSDVWFGISLQDPSKHLLTGGALLLQFTK